MATFAFEEDTKEVTKMPEDDGIPVTLFEMTNWSWASKSEAEKLPGTKQDPLDGIVTDCELEIATASLKDPDGIDTSW